MHLCHIAIDFVETSIKPEIDQAVNEPSRRYGFSKVRTWTLPDVAEIHASDRSPVSFPLSQLLINSREVCLQLEAIPLESRLWLLEAPHSAHHSWIYPLYNNFPEWYSPHTYVRWTVETFLLGQARICCPSWSSTFPKEQNYCSEVQDKTSRTDQVLWEDEIILLQWNDDTASMHFQTTVRLLPCYRV